MAHIYDSLTRCFYVPGQTVIIDMVRDGITVINGDSLEQVRERYPLAEEWDFDTAWQAIEKHNRERYVKAPQEITEERFDEMMNVLPPMKWSSGGGTESFMLCEALTGDLHSIFCRIVDRYFEMVDSHTLSHAEIVDKCTALPGDS